MITDKLVHYLIGAMLLIPSTCRPKSRPTSDDAPIQFSLKSFFVRTQFETLSYFGVFEHKRHAEGTPGTAVAPNAYRLRRK